MALKLNKKSKVRTNFSPLELLEADKELCKKVSDGIARLADLQEQLIRILPDCKKQMPGSAELLGDVKHQAEVLLYIQGISLYFFADAVWKIIKGQCIEMTKMYNNEMREDVEEKREELGELLDHLSGIPLEDIAQDALLGFYRLSVFVDWIKPRFDFIVISGSYGTWSFRDIAGTIATYGFPESCYKDFLDFSHSQNKSICKIDDDEEMKAVP